MAERDIAVVPRPNIWTQPAAVLAILQIVAIVGGGFFALGVMQSTVSSFREQLAAVGTNTRATADQLTDIVHRQETRTNNIDNRLVGVETSVKIVTDTVTRIDNKLDAIRSTQTGNR